MVGLKSVKEQVEEFANIVIEECTKSLKDINYDALEEAKNLILDAEKNKNRLHITGIGKPGHVAGYIASLFSSTGTPAYFLDGTEAIHGSAGQVAEGDVVIAISNSGETEELKKTVATLKNNNAKVISVTGKEESWLAKAGAVSLIAGVSNEGDYLNKPPRASIICEIMVLQALSVLLQNHRQITPKEYVKWHPGGSLGKSILEGEQK